MNKRYHNKVKKLISLKDDAGFYMDQPCISADEWQEMTITN